MKNIFYYTYLRGSFLVAFILLLASNKTFAQQQTVVAKATVNVRTIVQVKTQHLQNQFNTATVMPEHETPPTHPPAKQNIHLLQNEKKLESSATKGQPSPAPLNGFAGKPFDGYYPPDAHGAVSQNFVVSTVNDEMYVQDRNGNLISDVALGNFWAPVGVTHRLFDPRIVFDPNQNTWFLISAANYASDSACVLLGASLSADPTGSWNIYRIKADSIGLRWADYPNVAFNKNWVAITVNLFSDSSIYNDTGRVYVMNRNEVMNNSLQGATWFDIDPGVIPAVTYDSGENNLYLLEVYSEPAGQLQMLKISGTPSTPTIASVGYPAISMTWAPIPKNYADFGPQLGDTAKLQCNDDRMGNVLVKNNVIWCTHSVFLPAGNNPSRASILWWALDTTGNVLQYGLIDDSTASIFYAFPSISVNKFNDALIGYSVFSAGQYASAGYAYHSHDLPGSVNQNYTFINGLSTYNRSFGNRNRWGDCSATVTDPLNDIDFWTINEYADANANTWGSWWANVSGWDTLSHDPAAVIIAPNPNKGVFNLYILGEPINTPLLVDIYDLLGSKVYTTTSETKTIAISINTLQGRLAEGIYIVRIKFNGLTLDRKLLVR